MRSTKQKTKTDLTYLFHSVPLDREFFLDGIRYRKVDCRQGLSEHGHLRKFADSQYVEKA
jgi:hypothetical protein